MNSARRLVHVVNLGRQKYLTALNIQKKYARKLLDAAAGKKEAEGHNILLLVEHDPVYTIGIRTAGYGLDEENRLRSLGADFYRTNRGGLITFHGPGQLVAYPIINLRAFELGVRAYVACVERTVIDTCAHFGLTAQMSCDTGVWVEDRKIAAIGVHASRYVTTHGTALNCNTDLSWFDHIVPCGLVGKQVTSLSKELNSSIKIQEVIEPFLIAFCRNFGCDVTMVDKWTLDKN